MYSIYKPEPENSKLGLERLNEDLIESIIVPHKVDLTTLPRGKRFKVDKPNFTLEFFFNNRAQHSGIAGGNGLLTLFLYFFSIIRSEGEPCG